MNNIHDNDKEQKFNDIDALTDYIDKNKKVLLITRYKSGLKKGKIRCKNFSIDDKKILTLNGNEIDCMRLIRKYNLKYSGESYEKYEYSLYKTKTPKRKNTFSIGPKSVYGNTSVNLNIENHRVIVRKNLKTDYESKYQSKTVKTFDEKKPYVFLDIETTGLSPIVDDIIQIAIYESENNNYVKYLPLTKKKTNEQFSINKINDEKLKGQNKLTQEEVDEIMSRFDLENKQVLIWVPKNDFDRMFLEVYFFENGLVGLEKITFFNAKNLAKELDFLENYSKDSVAQFLGIDTEGSHSALRDCIIEKQIVEKILSKECNDIVKKDIERDLVREIYDLLMTRCNNREEAKNKYDEYCDFLKSKYQPITQDYDGYHRTRGKEGISIHHIDETAIDDIATRTNKAKKEKDDVALIFLKTYNQKERLVYANQVEHFLLHALIFAYNHQQSGGPHFLFGEILKFKIGIFEENSKEKIIQTSIEEKFLYISFEEICNIYKKITFKQYQKDKWKLDTYKYDNEKLKAVEKMLM